MVASALVPARTFSAEAWLFSRQHRIGSGTDDFARHLDRAYGCVADQPDCTDGQGGGRVDHRDDNAALEQKRRAGEQHSQCK